MATSSRISPFLSALVREEPGATAAFGNGSRSRAQAVALSVDVSESTALACRLAAHGTFGTERLNEILNGVLGPISDVIVAHGGDVVKFAGDGMVALWCSDRAGGESAQHASVELNTPLQTTFRRALVCARELESMSRELAGRSQSDLGRVAGMRLGMGVGSLEWISVGDDARRELVLFGDAIPDALEAERLSKLSRLALSPKLQSQFAGTDVEGTFDDQVHEAGPVWRATNAGVQAPEDDTKLSALMASHVPTSVREFGTSVDQEWLAELRSTSSVFVDLSRSVELEIDERASVLTKICRVIHDHGGELARVGVGLRGPVLLAAFCADATPEQSAAERALRAGSNIQAELAQHSLSGAIGVGTGRVFRGVLGGTARCEYTMVGESVNRAARLMELATGQTETGEAPPILSDANTQKSCTHLPHRSLGSMVLRGFEKPTMIWSFGDGEEQSVLPTVRSVGRAEELAVLTAMLDREEGRFRPGCAIVEGTAGIGKSRLLDDFQELAREQGCVVARASAREFLSDTPFRVWKDLVPSILEIPAEDPFADLIVELEARMSGADRAGAETSNSAEVATVRNQLLARVLGSESDTGPEVAMTDEARAQQTCEAIHDLVAAVGSRAPLVLVIDDAQWMDSASLAAVRLLAVSEVPVVLVLGVRMVTGVDVSVALKLIRDAPATAVISLGHLGEDGTRAVAARELGVDHVDSAVVDLLRGRAGGHPLFVQALTSSLHDAGVIQVKPTGARIAPNAPNAVTLDVPESVEAVLTTRIGRLDPVSRSAMKAASVLGLEFESEDLVRLLEGTLEPDSVPAILDGLVATGLLEDAPREGAVRFRHAIVRDAAYGLLPFAKRRPLHGEAAAIVKERAGEGADADPALLAHHLSMAVDPHSSDPKAVELAIDALEIAAFRAAAGMAVDEAVSLLERILELDDASSVSQSRQRRARWQRHLGEAYFRLGRFDSAVTQLLDVVSNLDPNGPLDHVRPVRRLRRELLEQITRRMQRRTSASRALLGENPSSSDDDLEAARACELLGLIWLLRMNHAPSLLGNLRALNLAERAGDSEELASAAAAIGVSAGISIGARTANGYFGRASRAAARIDSEYAAGRASHMLGLHAIGQGEWTRADRALSRSVEAFEHTGDGRWLEMSLLTFGNLHYMRRRFTDAEPFYERARTGSRRRGDIQAEAWSAVGLSGAQLALGLTDAATDTIAAMEDALANSYPNLSDEGSRFSIAGIQAMAALRRNDPDAAFERARWANDFVRDSPVMIYYGLPGYCYVPQVALRLWESAADASERTQARILARRGLMSLGQFAFFFPIARPQFALWTGTYWWLAGKPRLAKGSWNAALRWSDALGMSFDSALAYSETAGSLSPTDPCRRRYLKRAAELFGLCGAEVEANAARADLERAVS